MFVAVQDLTLVRYLAGAYSGMGEKKEAETLYTQVLSSYERLYGENIPELGDLLNDMAVFYSSCGRLTDAISNFQRCLRVSNGAKYGSVSITMANLGLAMLDKGELYCGEKTMLEGIEKIKKESNPDHPDVAYYEKSLADVYREQKRYQEARALCEHALPIVIKTYGQNHPETEKARKELARIKEDLVPPPEKQ